MKSIQLLKYVLPLVPVNAFAHPGHQEFAVHTGANGIVGYLVLSLVALAALAQLAVCLHHVRQRNN